MTTENSSTLFVLTPKKTIGKLPSHTVSCHPQKNNMNVSYSNPRTPKGKTQKTIISYKVLKHSSQCSQRKSQSSSRANIIATNFACKQLIKPKDK